MRWNRKLWISWKGSSIIYARSPKASSPCLKRKSLWLRAKSCPQTWWQTILLNKDRMLCLSLLWSSCELIKIRNQTLSISVRKSRCNSMKIQERISTSHRVLSVVMPMARWTTYNVAVVTTRLRSSVRLWVHRKSRFGLISMACTTTTHVS